MTEFSQDCLARMRRVTTAPLTTQLLKRGLRNCFMQGVRPLGQYGANLAGPAFTLRNIPAREDLDRVEGFANPEHPQRKAIETTPAGHVLVVDCRGDARAASGGEILMIETSLLKGKGNLTITGSLGDVMQESARAAVSESGVSSSVRTTPAWPRPTARIIAMSSSMLAAGACRGAPSS